MDAQPAVDDISVSRRICSFDTEVSRGFQSRRIVRDSGLDDHVSNTSRDVFVADYFAPVVRLGEDAGAAAAPANPNPCTSKLAG